MMSEVRGAMLEVRPTLESLAAQGLSDASDVSEVTAPARAGTHAQASRTRTPQSTLRVYTGDTSDASDKLEPVRVSGVGRTSDMVCEPPTPQKPAGSLRQTMPTVAAWIDDLRAAFGRDQIDPAIRAGMDGQPTFYARENGAEVGAKDPRRGVTLADTTIGPPRRATQAGRGE